MPSYWLQDNRGNRITIAAPPAVAGHKLISGPLADYPRLTETETEVRGKLADVEQRITEAEAEHVQALSVAIGAGSKEPAPPATAKLEATKLEITRRKAAIPAALDDAENKLVAAIEQARDVLQSEADARLVAARERARLALAEFCDAREMMTSERALGGWLEKFPQGAGRPPRKGTPPVRTLRGANGDPTPWDVVLSALVADLDAPAPPARTVLAEPVGGMAS